MFNFIGPQKYTIVLSDNQRKVIDEAIDNGGFLVYFDDESPCAFIRTEGEDPYPRISMNMFKSLEISGLIRPKRKTGKDQYLYVVDKNKLNKIEGYGYGQRK